MFLKAENFSFFLITNTIEFVINKKKRYDHYTSIFMMFMIKLMYY